MKVNVISEHKVNIWRRKMDFDHNTRICMHNILDYSCCCSYFFCLSRSAQMWVIKEAYEMNAKIPLNKRGKTVSTGDGCFLSLSLVCIWSVLVFLLLSFELCMLLLIRYSHSYAFAWYGHITAAWTIHQSSVHFVYVFMYVYVFFLL